MYLNTFQNITHPEPVEGCEWRLVNIFIFFVIIVFNIPIFAAQSIDVVIPCHEKDRLTLELTIASIKAYSQNPIGRIIVISEYPLTDQAEWFDQALFPFTKKDIVTIIFNNNAQEIEAYKQRPYNRIGWVYQQILKLYAPIVIPNINENVLIIDADTIFLRPVTFIDRGKALYATGKEYKRSYFEHAKRVLPGFTKVYPHYSGICHHMLMQRSVLLALCAQIEKHHHCPAWQALCRCIDPVQCQNLYASISEYELYFNYVIGNKKKTALRPLQWKNITFAVDAIIQAQKEGYHYVSCHEYRNKQPLTQEQVNELRKKLLL